MILYTLYVVLAWLLTAAGTWSLFGSPLPGLRRKRVWGFILLALAFALARSSTWL